MCTLSWLHRADGYSVFFNRDELRTRAPAQPPQRFLAGEFNAVAPTDGDAGGTWIGVNDRGLTVALLNRYEDTPHEPPTAPVSRGVLVRALLATSSLDAVLLCTSADILAAYRPFTLGIFAPATHPRVVTWNGDLVRVEPVESLGLVATSSGHDQAGAERARRSAHAAIDRLGVDALEAFHRGHSPERGPYSVCMHRPDATTVSYTRVDVGASTASLTYVSGPPCETTERSVEQLHLSGQLR